MMPEDGPEQLADFDGIFLGAVGYPGVADHISLWGLLIPIRRAFDQYANVRPLKLFEGVDSPLQGRVAGDIDLVIVRENAEGEYSRMGGRLYEGTAREMVIQESVFTRHGVDRILRHAFEIARKRAAEQNRKGRVTSATKSNGIIHTMPYWDERFAAMAEQYPHVETDQFHIDILSAHFVQHPDWFDVVVGSNLFWGSWRLGGGGGEGGQIVLLYNKLTNSGTFTITGGAAGDGGPAVSGTGYNQGTVAAASNGQAGSAGLTTLTQVTN